MVEPSFIYVEPQLSGTGWEHFAWTQLLGFFNLVSHSYSIPGLGKFYHCFPWTGWVHYFSPDFPKSALQRPIGPLFPMSWFSPVGTLYSWSHWSMQVLITCTFETTVWFPYKPPSEGTPLRFSQILQWFPRWPPPNEGTPLRFSQISQWFPHESPKVKELHWDFPKSRKGSLKNVIIPHSIMWPLKQRNSIEVWAIYGLFCPKWLQNGKIIYFNNLSWFLHYFHVQITVIQPQINMISYKLSFFLFKTAQHFLYSD